MEINYRKVFAIEQNNKKRWLKVNSKLTDDSGIYIMQRFENGISYAYVGQAKKILTRLAQHLNGYQHIDLSIKKHGLYSNTNKTGWSVTFVLCDENELDRKEQEYIIKYANAGYQLRNKTSGSQGNEKTKIDDYKNTKGKGYQQGLHNGYEKAIKEIKVFFDKYLEFTIKGKTNKTKERKYQEFKNFLENSEKIVDKDI